MFYNHLIFSKVTLSLRICLKYLVSLSTTNFPQSEADYESYMMDCYIPFTLTWAYNWGSSNQHNFYVAEGGINRMLDTPSDICAPWTLGGSWGGPCIYMA